LFAGRFKASHVAEDNYFKYMFAYIGLNPVKLIDKNWKEDGIKNIKKTIDFLLNYNYLSLIDQFKIKRKESKILSLDEFPEYFQSKKDFNDFIEDWLNFKK